MLHVDCGDDGLLGPVFTAIHAFHARTLAVLNDQARDRFIGQNDALMRLQKMPKSDAQHARAALRYWATVQLANQRESLAACADITAGHAPKMTGGEIGRAHMLAFIEL